MPIFVAASGPLAAKLAGRVGDGFICTSGKDPELYRTLLGKVEEGAAEAGRDSAEIRRQIEIKVSYDRDLDHAYKATHWWAALALTPEQKEGIEDPIEMERVADANVDQAHTRFIVSDDPAGRRRPDRPVPRPRLRGPRDPRPRRGSGPLPGAVHRRRAAAAAPAREREHRRGGQFGRPGLSDYAVRRAPVITATAPSRISSTPLRRSSRSAAAALRRRRSPMLPASSA